VAICLEERNMKRGPMSKAKTMPKSEREEKALTQTQNPSLGPKPFPNHIEANETKRGQGILKEGQA
jgi:hypothetical protein